MIRLKRYLWNILIAIDQLFNALFFGYPDETMSSRMGKRQDIKPYKFICNVLNIVDKNHCENSIEEDEGKQEVKK